METVTGTEPTSEERADLYRWFSSLFAQELDAAAWSSHVGDEFLSALDEQAGELGLEDEASALREFLVAHRADETDEAVLELAVDYARLFVGPGPGQAPPYESIYTGPKARLFGEAYADVVEVLQREGIGVAKDFHAPADHAAVELSVMAYLLDGPEDDAVPASRNVPSEGGGERAFFERHIMNWFPAWCRDIDEHDPQGFYRGVARFMMGFLRGEAARMEGGAAS